MKPRIKFDALRDAIDDHMYHWAQKYRRVQEPNGKTNVEIWWPNTNGWIPTKDWRDGLKMNEMDFYEFAEYFYNLGKEGRLDGQYE